MSLENMAAKELNPYLFHLCSMAANCCHMDAADIKSFLDSGKKRQERDPIGILVPQFSGNCAAIVKMGQGTRNHQKQKGMEQ